MHERATNTMLTTNITTASKSAYAIIVFGLINATSVNPIAPLHSEIARPEMHVHIAFRCLTAIMAKQLEPERQKLAAFLVAVEATMGDAKWRVANLIVKANNAPLGDDAGQSLQEALM